MPHCSNQTSFKKGDPRLYTEKHLKHLSKYWKDKDNPMYGKKREDWSKMNKTRKGKTWEEMYGKEKADKMRLKLSKSLQGKTWSKETREKMKSRQRGIKEHWKLILEESNKLSKQGYRCIPITQTIPDIIAIKNNKIYAIEVEVQRDRNYIDMTKYDVSGTKDLFDDIVWIIRRKK